MGNLIKLIKVSELLGKTFNIPSYQRGYKWTKKQAEDLLNDLDEFISGLGKSTDQDNFYCLQPLAVKRKSTNLPKNIEITQDDTEQKVIDKVKGVFNESIIWDVIDGQQRLTTIYLLLCYLNPLSKCQYTLSYETREKSGGFLEKFTDDQNEEDDVNVDFYHIRNVYKTIADWFKEKDDEYKERFKEIILHKTQFIWYETGEDAIKVFTRLNIGKIRLTNSELIKSMLMTKAEKEVKQYEIANEWDRIEQQLQNDELWYFIHGANYDKPTRIDFLFDTLCEYDILKKRKLPGNDTERREKLPILEKYIGTDQYRTFRYYDFELNENNKSWEEKWDEVKDLFEVINEWYNDVEFYHYIGYILCHKSVKLEQIYEEWKSGNTKSTFKGKLKKEIKGILGSCCKQEGIERYNIIEQQYEIEVKNKGGRNPATINKTVCRPILLLHNVQTVINQNKPVDDDEFKHLIFYRFPFHLYKTEKWDVEHIDSNTTNELKDNFSKLLWLLQFDKQFKELESLDNEKSKNIYNELIRHLTNGIGVGVESITEDEIKKRIKEFSFGDFDKLAEAINGNREETNGKRDGNNALDDNLKNQIGNYTLLDASTNRGYGNSIFPKKRLTIMAKDRSRKYELKLEKTGENWEFKDEIIPKKDDVSTFIPPVTRNVFMKYYTPQTADFTTWNQDDFDGYKDDIKIVLKGFLSVDNNDTTGN